MILIQGVLLVTVHEQLLSAVTVNLYPITEGLRVCWVGQK
jgi:hypothetical protein